MKEITGSRSAFGPRVPGEELADVARARRRSARPPMLPGAQGGARRMAARSAPLPPPTSVTVSQRPNSYVAAIAEADSAEIAVIASSKRRSASGSARRYSNAPLPRTFSRAGMPVSHRGQKFRERREVIAAAAKYQHRSHRAGNVAAQVLRERRVDERSRPISRNTPWPDRKRSAR